MKRLSSPTRRIMSKPRNPVAKFQRKYNKAKIFLDRKREAKKRGELAYKEEKDNGIQ
jgi:hypothetical protein